MTKKELTYQELLQKLEDQEVLIQKLRSEKHSITNFEFFVNESPDLVCIADTTAFFRVVNDTFVKVLGYSREELLSRPFVEFVHPDDLQKTFEEVQNLSHNKPTVNFDNRYIKKNGDILYLEWKANLNTANHLIYAVARDVTQFKITQEKLISSEKSLNEAQKIAKIGSWDFNLKTQELNWSNELYAIFEIEKEAIDPNLYAKYLARFLPEDIELLNQNIYNTITNKVSYEMEHRIVLDNNETKWVFCTGVPIMDNQNNVVALKGVVQNITQKKIIDDAIKAKEKAEGANKAKSEFLSNMSHEIRTPLNGIVGFTDLLLKTNFDKDQFEYLKTVNESANSLMEIINNILDFSKIESGKLELSYEEIDIIQLSNQIINLFKYEANHKKIDLMLEIDANVPPFVIGDSFRLKQILVNLLSNAMKFTFSGHIKLKIVQVEEEPTVSKIKFSVIDTGIGIKPQNQSKIFESFIQADNTTTRKYGGTGLGLTISNQLLNLKKSQLHLKSVYGYGSEFYFTVAFQKNNLKLNPIENSALDTNTIKEESKRKMKSLNNFKILIAEDNKINMLLAKTLVHKIISNVELFETTNGHDVVVMAAQEIPDLILMDIQMPIQNGYDATEEIRKNEKLKQIPIIALTAGVLNGEKEKCLQYGLSDYITKPIVQSELEKVLTKWLDT